MVGRILAGAMASEPFIRKRQYLYWPIFDRPQIKIYKSKPGKKIVNPEINFTQLTPNELEAERDKRLHSPEWEEFVLDNGNKYRVRYLSNKGNPVYQVDKYYNMEGTNIQSGWGSDLGVPYPEYRADGNNEDIYREKWLKNKYTSDGNIIKADTLKYFRPKDSPYNMRPNQK